MMALIRPRLRKPLGIALAGTVFAAAWALRGGGAWQLSVAMEVTVLASAVTTYVRAGKTTTTVRWPVPAPTSGRRCSACGRGPWAGISPWPPPSPA